MPSQRVFIKTSTGIRLAAVIDFPEIAPRAFAVFSHCFTCSKDLKAIVRISRRLAEHQIAVLRFDFTGLGDSEGDFSETNFETNVSDVLSVANWLRQNHRAPQLLMGLSLGAAAMMAAAHQIDSAGGLVTLAAPSCTAHLADYLLRQNPEIETLGAGDVTIGGRRHLIKAQLLTSLRQRNLGAEISSIRIPHLIMHSPIDETLGFYHAEKIFELTGGIKSFITLDGADHLMMSQANDVVFVADQIELWSRRWM